MAWLSGAPVNSLMKVIMDQIFNIMEFWNLWKFIAMKKASYVVWLKGFANYIYDYI